MLFKKKSEITESGDIIVPMGWLERHRRLSDARMRYRRDMWAYGELRWEQGVAAGIKEGKEDDARRMKAHGQPVETISQVTGFSADKITKL